MSEKKKVLFKKPSPFKRNLQAQKANLRNRSNRSAMRTVIKKLLVIVDNKKNTDATSLQQAFINAQSIVAKTARKGGIKKSTAQRKTRRLYAKFAQATAAIHA